MEGHIRQIRFGRSVPRRLLIFALAALFFSISYSQTGWETVSGGPSSEYTPLCVAVIDSLHAVAGGRGGFIAGTSDGGATWIRSYTGTTDEFRGVSFPDGRRGTVVGGAYSLILRTEDGGITWRRQSNGPFGPGESFNSVSFSDSARGVIVSGSGHIFYTTNGGEEWLSTGAQLYRGLRRVRMKSSYGIAVGYLGDTYRTTDAGRTWYYHSAMTYPADLNDVSLLDSLNAFVVGEGGAIRRTTDGGIFWTAVESGTTEDLRTVVFFDGSNGMIATAAGSILRTTDGGSTWSAPQASGMSSAADMAFAPGGFGLCVAASGGAIYRSGDGGASWNALRYSWTGAFLGVCSAAPGTVFAVGEEGMIASSSDSGRDWTLQPGPASVSLRDVRFADPSDGWIVGDSGTVMRTTDGGESWAVKPPPSADNLLAVAPRGGATATLVGENNAIFNTADGGTSWDFPLSPVFDHWQAVSFLDAGRGVAAGRNGSIIRTTDGGESWEPLHAAGSLSGIVYLDPLHIVAAGMEAGDSLRGLFITADGGLTWTFRRTAGREITAASFLNPAYGYVAGGEGGLYATQDSGASWINRSPSGGRFRAVVMSGPRAAYAAGDSGVIARMRADGAIAGRCFHDLDHDGIEDGPEGGLGGRTVYLGGPFSDSTLSGPDGWYTFPTLPFGTYIVRQKDALFWEQTAPAPPTPDTLTLSADSAAGRCRDAGFAGPSVRIRIPIFVSDSTSFAHRYVWCGIRPGATFGIWGTDPRATAADSAEAEFEIPPRSFVKFAGLFDARFSDPYYPLNVPSASFGEGSWTDSRPYLSPSQRDTFLLSFLPGYYFGGGYPMRLSWPSALVAKLFSGPVLLIDRYGVAVDMKTETTVTVADTSIESFLLVTQSPVFPGEWLARWRLLSLPAPVADGSVRSLFPSAESRAFTFVPGAGYTADDTLRPNAGYWLKYPTAVDTLVFDPAARLRDTVPLTGGWNLIGTLSAPVSVSSVSTDPPDAALGYFFGFEEGYVVADTLLPGKAYWVRSDRDASVILEAFRSGTIGPHRTRSACDRTLSGLQTIRIEDAGLNSGTLYIGEDGPAPEIDLPPFPPEGVFDARFASGRLAAAITPGAAVRHPIDVSSAKFPLTVTLSGGFTVPARIEYGDQSLALHPGEPVIVGDAGRTAGPGTYRHRLTLVVRGEKEIPAEYALLPNYPNPFNPATTLTYALPGQSSMTLRIYDLLGRLVTTLVNDVREAGYYAAAWNGLDSHGNPVAGGVYFCRLDARGVSGGREPVSRVIKMMLLK